MKISKNAVTRLESCRVRAPVRQPRTVSPETPCHRYRTPRRVPSNGGARRRKPSGGSFVRPRHTVRHGVQRRGPSACPGRERDSNRPQREAVAPPYYLSTEFEGEAILKFFWRTKYFRMASQIQCLPNKAVLGTALSFFLSGLNLTAFRPKGPPTAEVEIERDRQLKVKKKPHFFDVLGGWPII